MLYTYLCVDTSNKINENKLESIDHETLGIEEGTRRDACISLEREVEQIFLGKLEWRVVTDNIGRIGWERGEMG